MKSSQFLEKLQKEQFDKKQIDPVELRKKELDEMIKVISGFEMNDLANKFLDDRERGERVLSYNRQIKFYEEAARTCPKYERLTWYVIMKSLMDEVFYIVPELRIELQKMTAFGSLSTGNVNAMTMPVPNSKQKIIVFEDEIFILCNTLCKIIAKSIPYKTQTKDGRKLTLFSWIPDEIESNIRKNKEIIRWFRNFIFSYLFKGAPSVGQSYNLLGAPYDVILRSLRDSMETFIICHEIAHIQLRHAGDYLHVSDLPAIRGVKEVRNFWKKEYQADAKGLLLSKRILDEPGNHVIYYVGAHLFFSFNEILNKSIMLMRTDNDSIPKRIFKNQSHPPPMQRLEHIKKLVTGQHGKECIEASLISERILKVLYEDLKKSIHLKYSQGKKLNGKFDSYLI